MKNFLLKFIFIWIFIPCISLFAQKQSKEESEVYDLVQPKTLEIDNDIYYEHISVGNILKNGETVSSDFTFPSSTFRTGLIKNLELQLIFGYFGVNANANGVVKIRKALRPISVSKSISGLDAASLGFKLGLLSENKSRPSIALNSIFTMPFVGVPAFRPDHIGSELYLNTYKTLSEESDILLDLGVIWNGYDVTPYPNWYYKITPEIYATDNFIIYAESFGYSEKKSAPENRVSLGFDITFSDNVDAGIYIGTSLNTKKFFFIGSSMVFTIPL